MHTENWAVAVAACETTGSRHPMRSLICVRAMCIRLCVWPCQIHVSECVDVCSSRSIPVPTRCRRLDAIVDAWSTSDAHITRWSHSHANIVCIHTVATIEHVLIYERDHCLRSNFVLYVRRVPMRSSYELTINMVMYLGNCLNSMVNHLFMACGKLGLNHHYPFMRITNW